MLRLRGVHYEEREVTPQEKARIIAALPEPARSDDIVEFLYLRETREGGHGVAMARLMQFSSKASIVTTFDRSSKSANTANVR
jgi:hypothetical protein